MVFTLATIAKITAITLVTGRIEYVGNKYVDKVLARNKRIKKGY